MLHISIIKNRFTVTKNGLIKNLKTGKFLKHQICKAGYHRVGLSCNGKRKIFAVHRLVMMVHKPNKNVFSPKLEVNHKDGDKSNNHISNLEWCTRKENMAHTRNTLKRKMGGTENKLRNEMISYLREKYKREDVAILLNTTQENISLRCKQHRKRE